MSRMSSAIWKASPSASAYRRSGATSCRPRIAPELRGPDEERAGLQRLQVSDLGGAERRGRGFRCDVERLAADHAERARRLRQPMDQAYLQPRLDAALRRRQHFERQRLQRVAGQHGRRLVPLHVHRRLAPTQRVVVHARKVVVHEAVGVDALGRRGGAQRLCRRHPEHRRRLQRQKGPQPFATGQHCVAHRHAEGSVAGRQESLQRRFDAGCLLAQDGVKLQALGVHRVRRSRPAGCAAHRRGLGRSRPPAPRRPSAAPRSGRAGPRRGHRA